jgi:hypothetical protein
MAIDAKHRASIYQKFLPLLGDEDANVFMSEFPSVEAAELVTKDFLRAELALTRAELRSEMAELRTELKDEMAELRTELKDEMAELRTELKDEMAGLRTGMASLESRLTVRMGGAIGASTSIMLAALALLR